MPRSRSVMTKTGVWNFSAKSKASMDMEKHSWGEAGEYMGCLVSPWESSAGVVRSVWGGRGGKLHGVLGIARGEQRGGDEVALRGAGRQAGGGPDALDVEDDGGDLGVVAEADELAHERDAGTGI